MGSITVNLNGSNKTITQYYASGISNCDALGCANFSLSPGSYNFTATAGSLTWNGTITSVSGGCSKLQLTSSGGGGTGGSGSGNKAQAIFFTNAATTPITVVVSGLTSYITAPVTNGTYPTCGAVGSATFDLGVGTHSWTASNAKGDKWNGTVTVAIGDCKATGLNAGTGSGTGGGATGYGKLIVYENFDHGGGTITVKCNGQNGYVTSYYSSATISNPPACGSSGCANFNLPVGAYTVTASDSKSSWSRSMTIVDGGCSAMLLQ